MSCGLDAVDCVPTPRFSALKCFIDETSEEYSCDHNDLVCQYACDGFQGVPGSVVFGPPLCADDPLNCNNLISIGAPFNGTNRTAAEFGFERALYADGVVVYQANWVGFLSEIHLFDKETQEWVRVWWGGETYTEFGPYRKAYFDVEARVILKIIILVFVIFFCFFCFFFEKTAYFNKSSAYRSCAQISARTISNRCCYVGWSDKQRKNAFHFSSNSRLQLEISFLILDFIFIFPNSPIQQLSINLY